MKRQEICDKTGLTPKALRLYEEKGLITPAKEGLHNKTRVYSQEDLERLQIIATLRKAMFTLEEIRRMLDAPETIQVIFPQYLAWLRAQQRKITDLLAASEQVDLGEIKTAKDLTGQIESAARSLPIPASDIHFRFRALDELEVARTSFTTEQQMDRLLPGSAAYRSSVVAISRDKMDNTLAFNSQLNDTWQANGDGGRRVGDRTAELTFPQRLLRWGIDLLILLLLFLAWQNGTLFPVAYGLIPAALLRLAFFWKDQNAEKKRWIAAIGAQADFSEDRRRVFRIAGIILLLLTVVAISSIGLMEIMRPVEPVGGPSTANLDMDEFFENMPMRQLFRMDRPEGYAREDFFYSLAPEKIYFSVKYSKKIYSIDADYQNLTEITDKACFARGSLSAVDAPEERPCSLIWYDGGLYFLASDNRSYTTGRYYLMRHETGGKVRPQKLCSGGFEALGLSDDGKIILYTRPDSKWTEVLRVDPKTGEPDT